MATSYWHLRRPPAARPHAELPTSVDVAVVGAGVTGLTTALLLARAGRSVAVLEGRHVSAGTTGRSTAKLSLLQGTRLSTLARQHPIGVLRQYVEAHREGQAWLLRLAEQHGVSTQRRPAITYAGSDRDRSTARREMRLANECGLPAVWDEDLELPFATSGGVRLDDQAQVDPVELLAALADEATAHGATIHEYTRVRRVRGSDPVRLELTSAPADGRPDEEGERLSPLSAGTVVVATGMPLLDRGAFFARMVPSRSYTLALATPGDAPGGMYLSAAGGTASRSLRAVGDPRPGGASDDAAGSVTGSGGDVLLVGGSGHTTGRDDAGRRLAELRSWSRERFGDSEELAAWSAQDFVPARGLPFAGPALPGAGHVLVAGGFAKWGMTGGPAAALALSSRILGGSTPWAETFDPWAARELRSLPGLAKDNAGVGFEMARSWIRPLVGTDEGHGKRGRLSTAGPRPVARSTVDGVGRTVSGVCTHLGGVVRWNDAEASWDCPLHGSRFGPAGEVLEGPATCGLRRS